MKGRSRRYIIGGLIVLAALSYLIYTGMQDAVVYFVTPSELKAQTGTSDRFLRLGGMVVQGSLQTDLKKLTYRFQITDGAQSIPVHFQGIPPDLFAEGKGAVVEGKLDSVGIFQATTIMAKHAEEYSPPAKDHPASRSFVPSKETQRP